MELPFKMIVETEIEQYRVDTFWTKEPETIEWIKSFKDGDPFIDVGCNVGVYSLYAGSLFPDSPIYAIEPDRRNYARLLQNVALNNFSNVLCLNMALSNYSGIDTFYVKQREIGSSGGQIVRPADETGHFYNPVESYRILKVNLMALMRICHFPEINHIKIDVDGHEQDILEGFWTENDFVAPGVKSILIEINEKSGVYDCLLENGFTTDNPFNKMDNHSRVRRAREGIKAENVIFTRRDD